jgi:hypothetical protein
MEGGRTWHSWAHLQAGTEILSIATLNARVLRNERSMSLGKTMKSITANNFLFHWSLKYYKPFRAERHWSSFFLLICNVMNTWTGSLNLRSNLSVFLKTDRRSSTTRRNIFHFRELNPSLLDRILSLHRLSYVGFIKHREYPRKHFG